MRIRGRTFIKPTLQLKDRFEVSRSLRERHGRFNKKASATDVAGLMKKAESDAIAVGMPRPNYSFSARDVVAIGESDDGEYFVLGDGREFFINGEPLKI